MKTSHKIPQKFIIWLALSAMLTQTQMAWAQVTIAQKPLVLSENVPGNLVLTPSVEFPTINSNANIGAYSTGTSYSGYFDPFKCYEYRYSATETERHFYPISTNTTRTCTNAWSGNYLNWATTQTIDPFRKALTGGYRVKDTTTETWLEKARVDGQSNTNNFPNGRIPNSGNSSSTVEGATPFSGNFFNTRIHGLGNQMRFRLAGDVTESTITPEAYDPSVAVVSTKIYFLSVRVAVCVDSSTVDPETNCKKYGSNYKPEGLIQKYAETLRYSTFGYLNDASTSRDGGVLRARQKFVGPREFDPTVGWRDNPAAEWDKDTGILIRNPDAADATATSSNIGVTISDSGVINYINKFGQMTNGNHKKFDPVSELYYAATRYLKNQGNVSSYSSVSSSLSASDKYYLADGFPIITNWTDPYQYWCQPSAILGIGDTNTHRDKNLPGNTSILTQEPARPTEVTADNTVNVVTALNKIAQLEGITINTPLSSGDHNSAYIAALAYDNKTVDIRPGETLTTKGKQTVSTFWVDVLEYQTIKPRATNQYWLATKYGGFKAPENYDPYSNTTALDQDLWHTNGQSLSVSGGTIKKPDNYFVASKAEEMIASLEQAFARISDEMDRSGASLTANSTRLETGTAIYQSIYKSASFEGDLVAYSVNPSNGAIEGINWRASGLIPGQSSRKIFFHDPTGSSANTRYEAFEWSKLNSAQKTALSTEDTLLYIRGERSKEAPAGSFRKRTGLLGSIINSQPVLVGKPAPSLYTGNIAYATFAASQASRTPVLYVASNDGMLHGFNANTGAETYAFIPNSVILNGLKDYAATNYSHKYFLDGEITVADVFIDNAWKSVLVGTLGRGGKAVYALDVTNPADVKFLWEKNATDIPELGNFLGKPIIAQVANGQWRALLGNGPNSTGNKAQLISINLADGTATSIDTGVGSNNGLSGVFAWDSDTPSDGYTDTAYAGDLNGNLWRFSNLGGTTPTVTRLFTAKNDDDDVQPITAAPLAGKDSTGQVWVFFGTGRYINTTDMTNDDVQSWYGLKDGSLIANRSELVERDVLLDSSGNDFEIAGNPDFKARVIEQGTTAELASQRGWYIDLPQTGERMVLPNRFRGSVLIGTSRIPDVTDRCAPTGRGFVMTIDPFTGARLPYSFLDINFDGTFNNSDLISIGGQLVPVSGLGVFNAPYNPIFTGNVMQFNREDGRITSVVTAQQPGNNQTVRRTSWREVKQP